MMTDDTRPPKSSFLRVLDGGLVAIDNGWIALTEHFGRPHELMEYVSYSDLQAYLVRQGFTPEVGLAAAKRWHGHD